MQQLKSAFQACQFKNKMQVNVNLSNYTEQRKYFETVREAVLGGDIEQLRYFGQTTLLYSNHYQVLFNDAMLKVIGRLIASSQDQDLIEDLAQELANVADNVDADVMFGALAPFMLETLQVAAPRSYQFFVRVYNWALVLSYIDIQGLSSTQQAQFLQIITAIYAFQDLQFAVYKRRSGEISLESLDDFLRMSVTNLLNTEPALAADVSEELLCSLLTSHDDHLKALLIEEADRGAVLRFYLADDQRQLQLAMYKLFQMCGVTQNQSTSKLLNNLIHFSTTLFNFFICVDAQYVLLQHDIVKNYVGFISKTPPKIWTPFLQIMYNLWNSNSILIQLNTEIQEQFVDLLHSLTTMLDSCQIAQHQVYVQNIHTLLQLLRVSIPNI